MTFDCALAIAFHTIDGVQKEIIDNQLFTYCLLCKFVKKAWRILIVKLLNIDAWTEKCANDVMVLILV